MTVPGRGANQSMRFDVVRDPLWNNIRLDELTRELVDTSAFQRLRYVRQLGLAHLVYPGATHTRFEHALGTYHLAGLALSLLEERAQLSNVSHSERGVVRAAALLHDIGHYPFSHALEEIGVLHHEEVARPLICDGPVAQILAERFGEGTPLEVWALVRGRSTGVLQGLISGSLDLDKIEYLKRDALMCGVPYGEIDVDRLLNSLVVVEDAGSGPSIGVLEKGLSALESLLFAKYQMYRNVYWHHAVRSATAMYKRIVDDALQNDRITVDSLTALTDEGLLHLLDSIAPTSTLAALRGRRLYKRAIELPASELGPDEGEWISSDRQLTRRAEDRLSDQLGIPRGDLLLDYPAKTQMLGVDISVLTRSGSVERLAPDGLHGAINLPSLSDRLYRSARWLRVFTAERMSIPPGPLRALVCLDSRSAAELIDSDRPLLHASSY